MDKKSENFLVKVCSNKLICCQVIEPSHSLVINFFIIISNYNFFSLRERDIPLFINVTFMLLPLKIIAQLTSFDTKSTKQTLKTWKGYNQRLKILFSEFFLQYFLNYIFSYNVLLIIIPRLFLFFACPIYLFYGSVIIFLFLVY